MSCAPNHILDNCLIWPSHLAKVFRLSDNQWLVEGSDRSGGDYLLDWETTRDHQFGIRRLWDLDERHKSRITTWLVDQRRLGVDFPRITTSVIEQARVSRDLTADERAERLLGFLAQKTGNLGSNVRLNSFKSSSDDANITASQKAVYNNTCQALAISESSEFEELVYLLEYLKSAGWIELLRYGVGEASCIVTVEGYRRIAEQEVNPSADQVFVAMWFDPSMDEARDKGIRPAILNTGYRPQLINEKPDVDKIDDEIIGEIRRSRFLIADFTYGDKGIRGGVYYEAGFALGLGLEVIRSCRADQIDDLHFDVNHHYHIAWKTPEELREGLERRILALVGEGPRRENIPPRNAS